MFDYNAALANDHFIKRRCATGRPVRLELFHHLLHDYMVFILTGLPFKYTAPLIEAVKQIKIDFFSIVFNLAAIRHENSRKQ